jgi:hypothetical protein
MKFRPVGAELFSCGGRTDRHDKTNSHFFFAILRTRPKMNVFRVDITVQNYRNIRLLHLTRMEDYMVPKLA